MQRVRFPYRGPGPVRPIPLPRPIPIRYPRPIVRYPVRLPRYRGPRVIYRDAGGVAPTTTPAKSFWSSPAFWAVLAIIIIIVVVLLISMSSRSAVVVSPARGYRRY